MTDKQPSQKRCSKCGETKSLDAFAKNNRTKDGLYTRCKTCLAEYRFANRETIRERKRAYHIANRDVILEKRRASYATNPQKKLEQDRAYRAKNVEYLRRYFHDYHAKNAQIIREKRQKNADRIRERRRNYNAKKVQANREYRQKHAEKYREYSRVHRASHPDIYRAACQRRRARIKGNGGDFTEQELSAICIKQAGVCFYCQWQHDPDELTIDQGGRHEAANIVLACGICNSSKGNRTPEQWINRWYERKPKRKGHSAAQ